MRQIFDDKQPTLQIETGSKRVMMCLDEQVETRVEPAPVEGGEPVERTQYSYDVTWLEPNSKSKGDLVNAIIRTKYSESDELAIQRHYANSKTAYKEEWQEYNEWCEQAKTWVKEALPQVEEVDE